MLLKDIIGDYPILDIVGKTDVDINGINHDSRMIKEGYIFLAIKGFTVDGHGFIDNAIDNGAKCIIYTDTLPYREGLTYIKVRDTVDALSYLLNNFYDRPWSKINMIGITGTNGKTSVSYFIKEIFQENGKEAGVIGTLGLSIEKDNHTLKNTTPDIQVTLESINRMVDRRVDACIMEVSSHSLALNRVKGIKYDVGIFTNLTKDHLDYHGTMENYFLSKLLLFKNTVKCNIINIDDLYAKRILEYFNSSLNLTYGIDEDADISAKNINYSMDGVEFDAFYKDEIISIKLNIPGKFSVYNALASIACGITFNVPMETIKIALEKIKSIKGRFEVLPINKNYNVIIDFAHTPDGLFNVLSAINDFSMGRLIVVFGAGGNRDKSKRSVMGEVVGKMADYAIVTTDNPRHENPKKIIDDILVGIKSTDIEYKAIIDRKEAIKYALDIAMDNDIILLAGKGHEEHMIIGDKTIEFNEREIVYQLISKK